MNRCVYCWKDFDSKDGTYKSNVCDLCSTPKELGAPYFRETIGNKYEGNLSKSWVDELKRSTIVPTVNKDDPKSYFVGRKGDNGKIQEKTVDTYL